MLYRLPEGFRYAGVIAVAAWLATYLNLYATDPVPRNEIVWALALGLALLAAGILLDTRSARRRIPFLRPPTYDLGQIVARWRDLRRRLDVPRTDSSAPADLVADLRIVDRDTDAVIAKHFEDWAAFYSPQQQLPPEPDWGNCDRFVEERYFALRNLLNDLHGGRYHGILS